MHTTPTRTSSLDAAHTCTHMQAALIPRKPVKAGTPTRSAGQHRRRAQGAGLGARSSFGVLSSELAPTPGPHAGPRVPGDAQAAVCSREESHGGSAGSAGCSVRALCCTAETHQRGSQGLCILQARAAAVMTFGDQACPLRTVPRPRDRSLGRVSVSCCVGEARAVLVASSWAWGWRGATALVSVGPAGAPLCWEQGAKGLGRGRAAQLGHLERITRGSRRGSREQPANVFSLLGSVWRGGALPGQDGCVAPMPYHAGGPAPCAWLEPGPEAVLSCCPLPQQQPQSLPQGPGTQSIPGHRGGVVCTPPAMPCPVVALALISPAIGELIAGWERQQAACHVWRHALVLRRPAGQLLVLVLARQGRARPCRRRVPLCPRHGAASSRRGCMAAGRQVGPDPCARAPASCPVLPHAPACGAGLLGPRRQQGKRWGTGQALDVCTPVHVLGRGLRAMRGLVGVRGAERRCSASQSPRAPCSSRVKRQRGAAGRALLARGPVAGPRRWHKAPLPPLLPLPGRSPRPPALRGAELISILELMRVSARRRRPGQTAPAGLLPWQRCLAYVKRTSSGTRQHRGTLPWQAAAGREGWGGRCGLGLARLWGGSPSSTAWRSQPPGSVCSGGRCASVSPSGMHPARAACMFLGPRQG